MSANKLSTLPWLMFMKCTLYTKCFKLRRRVLSSFENALFGKMLKYEIPGERFEITFSCGKNFWCIENKFVKFWRQEGLIYQICEKLDTFKVDFVILS